MSDDRLPALSYLAELASHRGDHEAGLLAGADVVKRSGDGKAHMPGLMMASVARGLAQPPAWQRHRRRSAQRRPFHPARRAMTRRRSTLLTKRRRNPGRVLGNAREGMHRSGDADSDGRHQGFATAALGDAGQVVGDIRLGALDYAESSAA